MTNNYEYDTLLVEQEGRLLKVTLNRPETLNAVGGGMHEALHDLWFRVRTDNSVGAILLTGAGRAFSSGGDVKGMAATAARGAGGGSAESEDGGPSSNKAMQIGSLLQGPKRLIMEMLDVEQPIICAVHGYAVGLGASIALCSDIVIAADDAILRDDHVGIGLVAGDGGTVIWPMLLPVNTAKYFLMSGDPITGKRAAELGLVVKSVPAEDLYATAYELAARLAAGPTLAIKFTKMAVNKAIKERANLLFDTSLLLEGATFISDDHANATAAWVERRAPEFKGH
jgi:enoyl-CoA hydratase